MIYRTRHRRFNNTNSAIPEKCRVILFISPLFQKNVVLYCLFLRYSRKMLCYIVYFSAIPEKCRVILFISPLFQKSVVLYCLFLRYSRKVSCYIVYFVIELSNSNPKCLIFIHIDRYWTVTFISSL
jgi:hypothetical protein